MPLPAESLSRSLRSALLWMHSSTSLPSSRLRFLSVPGSQANSSFSKSVSSFVKSLTTVRPSALMIRGGIRCG